MIYVFENPNNNASVVYDETSLTEIEKNKGIAVIDLPEKETIAGKYPILKCRKSTGEVWWEYEDVPKDPEVEQLKQVVADLTEFVLFGGAE